MFAIVLNGLALGLIASPSCPSNAEEIRVGTRRGFPGAALVGLGAVVGDAAVLVVVLLGLAPLLVAVPAFSTALWIVGAVVLAYIGIGILRDVRATSGVDAVAAAPAQPGTSAPRAFWAGFAITTFNPFTILWWVGLLAPALEDGGAVLPFAIAVLAGALVWFLGLAVLLHVGRRRLTARVRRWILVASAAAILVYAGYFAWRGVGAVVGGGTIVLG